MRLDVAPRQPPRLQGEDLVVEAPEAQLALRDNLRLEASLAILGVSIRTAACSVASAWA
jgi:hypothetical protein